LDGIADIFGFQSGSQLHIGPAEPHKHFGLNGGTGPAPAQGEICLLAEHFADQPGPIHPGQSGLEITKLPDTLQTTFICVLPIPQMRQQFGDLVQG